jgi:arylamine N-acetyltransferase
MLTSDGRLTLSDMKLIRTRNGVREERILASEEEWSAILKDNFDVSRP